MDFQRKVESGHYPGRVLAYHVGLRGLQVGSVAGLLVGTPLAMWTQKNTTLSQAWAKSVPRCGFLGGAIALGYTFAKHYDDVSGVDDRAFRLLQNIEQRNLDEYSRVGISGGAVVGAIAGRMQSPILVATMFTGLVLAVGVYMGEKECLKRGWDVSL